MAKEWHYAIDGEKHGPVTSQQLKELVASGELQPTDLVWTEGQNEWKPASGIKGLFPTKPSGKTPPPVPAASTITETGSADNSALPNEKVRQFVKDAAEKGIRPSVAFPAV